MWGMPPGRSYMFHLPIDPSPVKFLYWSKSRVYLVITSSHHTLCYWYTISVASEPLPIGRLGLKYVDAGTLAVTQVSTQLN